jgi:uncharacterized tellurite resistance protein B-like protein
LRRKPGEAISRITIERKHRGFLGHARSGRETIEQITFGSIKAFVSKLVDGANQRNHLEGRDRLIAVTALLIRVATVRHDLTERRRTKLAAILRSSYGLDDTAAVRLNSDSEAVCRTAVDLY